MSEDKHWLNKEEYPFEPHFFNTEAGRIHYVDTGRGTPIVMIHGNPTWSFLYRNLIKQLSLKYRCIAVDNLGFGLSDKPREHEFLPSQHAGNLDALIKHLDLKDIVLMVHDWGGPIGLSYAYNNPGNVKKIIMFNTWSWPVKGDKYYEQFSGFMGGTIGRFLIKNLNFFVRVIMKKASSNKKVFTKEVMKHYLMPFVERGDRKASWVLPKQIIDSTPWLEELWGKRERISNHPVLLIWGAKDIAFRDQELSTWKASLENIQVFLVPDAGHFVQEESYQTVLPVIEKFLESK